ERTADRDASGVDALPPGGFARRQVAGLRIEARWRPPTLRDAPGRQEGVAHHGPEEGARRHVAELAAGGKQALTRGQAAGRKRERSRLPAEPGAAPDPGR